MTEPKPVKAWAVVQPDGTITAVRTAPDAARRLEVAVSDRGDGCHVIPVTITPGHEAEHD